MRVISMEVCLLLSYSLSRWVVQSRRYCSVVAAKCVEKRVCKGIRGGEVVRMIAKV